MELRDAYEAIRREGAVVWAVSPDDRARLQTFADDEKIPFPILVDAGAATVRRFGILNEDDDRGIPHPTAVVVDRDGIIRYRRTDIDYTVRPPVEEILEVLRDL